MGVGAYMPLYKYLDQRFGTATTFPVVFRKAACDLAFSIGVDLPIFLGWTAFVERADPTERLHANYPDMCKAALVLHTPLNVVMFTVVPPYMRVIVLDLCKLFVCSLLFGVC